MLVRFISLLNYAGFRTLDSVVRLRKTFGQDSVTIISQAFHNERAIYLATNENIRAIGYNAHDISKKSGAFTNIREKFAPVKVFIDGLTNKQPKFLGDKNSASITDSDSSICDLTRKFKN